MAEEVKRLGATEVVANTDTALYTVPTGKRAVVATIQALNRNAGAQTIRLAHIDGALVDLAEEDYIEYNYSVAANTAARWSIGICMEAGDILMVRASHADVRFLAWGSEIDD